VLSQLKRLVREQGRSVLFVGVGNVLHSDDGIGVYISERIRETEQIRVISAEVSIENYIGKINAIDADVVVIVDSVHYGREPGYAELSPVDRLLDFTTHTHNISLRKTLELFHAMIWVLGIQPESVAFGEHISQAVVRTADDIVRMINGD
jgi:hydrogenase maturation protease